VGSNVTIEAWVNFNLAGTLHATIVATQAFRFQIKSADFLHWAWTNGITINGANGTVGITRGSWQHVAGVKRGNAVTFYINGTTTGTGTVTVSRTITSLRIGVDGLSGIGEGETFGEVFSTKSASTIEPYQHRKFLLSTMPPDNFMLASIHPVR
jgi:hypothetical protein